MSLLDDYDNMHCPGAVVRFAIKAVDAQRDEMMRRLGGHPEREDRT